MRRAGIAYTEINIETDPAAAAVVERVNGGNQTVPTVVLPDGTAMTNPSVRDILGRPHPVTRRPATPH